MVVVSFSSQSRWCGLGWDEIGGTPAFGIGRLREDGMDGGQSILYGYRIHWIGVFSNGHHPLLPMDGCSLASHLIMGPLLPVARVVPVCP